MTPGERADANGHGPYCDRCGDCLKCYGDEPCFAFGVDDGVGHIWPEDDDDEDGDDPK